MLGLISSFRFDKSFPLGIQRIRPGFRLGEYFFDGFAVEPSGVAASPGEARPTNPLGEFHDGVGHSDKEAPLPMVMELVVERTVIIIPGFG